MDLHLISLILVVKRMLSSSLTVAEAGRPIWAGEKHPSVYGQSRGGIGADASSDGGSRSNESDPPSNHGITSNPHPH